MAVVLPLLPVACLRAMPARYAATALINRLDHHYWRAAPEIARFSSAIPCRGNTGLQRFYSPFGTIAIMWT